MSKVYKCDFCGAVEDGVKKFIVGTDAGAVCFECVDVCAEMKKDSLNNKLEQED